MTDLRRKASQTKAYSFIESIFNVLVGLGINVGLQTIVFPWFGIYIPFSDNLKIAGIFTVVSIARSFLLRRGFNWWHVRKM